MNASDVMTRGPIFTIDEDTSIADAAQLMVKLRLSGLPVVDRDGKLVGILSEGDLLHRAELGTEPSHKRLAAFLLSPGRMADEYVHSHSTKVGDLMTREVITAAPDTPLATIVGLFEQHGIKRVPIVDGDRLLGMVSRIDLVRALLQPPASTPPAHRSDADVLKDVTSVFEDEVWGRQADVRVEVHEGVVELWGLIYDQRERAALRVAAGTITGVKSVRDHLTWVNHAPGRVISPGVPF